MRQAQRSLNDPAPEIITDNEEENIPDNRITIDDLPDFPEELFMRRMQSAQPVVKHRSMKNAKRSEATAGMNTELREFDARYRDPKGKLEANPLR